MVFYYKQQKYSINTKNPNIIILPDNKVMFYGGSLESLPPHFLDGSFLLSLIKLVTLQGGITKATLVEQ